MGLCQICISDTTQSMFPEGFNMLNFIPVLRLILTRRDTSSVLKKVTMGIGAFIHVLNAYARLVSSGFTTFIFMQF